MIDLTILYSTAQKAPKAFRAKVRNQLRIAAGHYPIVDIIDTPEQSSITNYYTRLLETVKQLDTPYVAFAEDDVLYPDEHFNFRPPLDTFAYNFTRWNLNVADNPPYFSLRQRKILATLIAPRQQFIEVMEQRLKLPESKMVEPGRRPGEKVEIFNTYNPVIVFQHPTSFAGTNKRASRIRALELPYFGTANKIKEYYEKSTTT